MKFKFSIKSISYLRFSDIYILDGILEEGLIQSNDIGMIHEINEIIHIDGIGLPNIKDKKTEGWFTLSIEKPTCSLALIKNDMLLSSDN